jgi:zinc protease
MLIRLLLLLLVSGSVTATPMIQHWQSKTGAEVYFIEAPELPMVDVQVVFDAGSARDGAVPGLADFVNGMLEEGIDGLDANKIAEGFDAVGAQFSLSASKDTASLSIRTLTQEPLLEQSLSLFSRVISTASFPEAAINRVRQQSLAGLEHNKQSAGKIASRAFYKALYGNHPYASISFDEAEKSIRAISRQQLVDFYQRYYVANNSLVAIVGALSRAEAEKIAERVTTKLPMGSKAPAIEPVEDLKVAQTITLKHPSSQTHILMGQPGYKRGEQDKFALYVGNHILGGNGLVSRISDEIREKRGLSYSAYSYFSPSRERGVFVLGLQTKNNSSDEALKVLKQTLVRFIDEGPTEAELNAARKNITGSFPLNIDSNRDLISYLVVIGFYGLNLDYFNTFIPAVNAVTVEQIKEAYKRRVDPEKMVTVLVGGA